MITPSNPPLHAGETEKQFRLQPWKRLAQKRADLLREAYAALTELDACCDALCNDRDYADAVVATRNGQEAHKKIITAARAADAVA